MAQPNNLSKAGSLPPIFSQMQDLLAEDLRHACFLGDKGGASKTGESPQLWSSTPSRCFPASLHVSLCAAIEDLPCPESSPVDQL